jgi:hypothetical protein
MRSSAMFFTKASFLRLENAIATKVYEMLLAEESKLVTFSTSVVEVLVA